MGRLLTLYVRVLNRPLKNWPIRQVLRWLIKKYGDRLVLLIGFGAEGMVLLDIMMKIDPLQSFRVVTLDTLRLPQQTHDLIARCVERYGLRLEIFYPDPQKIAEMELIYGKEPYRTNKATADICCNVRKTEQMPEVLESCDAWIASLRREQGGQRKSIRLFKVDQQHADRPILKIHPLAFFTEADVWDYIRENKVPYNALHDEGWRSIGCKEPCTVATPPGKDPRAGRFPLFQIEGAKKTECGLHFAEESFPTAQKT